MSVNNSIFMKGARINILKNIDVEIPRDKLVVITGLSGSGKSSLAFDTLYAEGQRRYVESLSAYVELPLIADGYWKMVDRNPGTSAYTNVSLCVYDEATGAAYLLTMDI